MFYAGEQKPDATTGARPHGARRGRRPGTGPGLPRSGGRRSSGVYGLAGLAVLAVWGAWSLGVVGCTGPGSGYAWKAESPGALFTNMRLSPEEISRLERNAHYYKLMGQPELGLREVELAHQQNPDNLQLTDFLAQNYEELGKFEAARQLYQEALTRHGPHAVLANNLCFSYYQEGRWQEAETCFRQTLDRDPGNVSARNNLGLLYCRLGRQDEARRLWQEAEGVAAADTKIGQALAVLGMPESPAYARKPEPSPPAARVTQAPAPKTAVSRLSAPIPAKPDTPAPPVTPKVSAGHLAAEPPAPTPAPAAAKPPAPTPAVVATKPPVPTPAPVAAVAATKPPAPTSAPAAASPRPEARKQAAAAPKALAAKAPAPPVPQAAPAPQAPPAAAELADAAIEVRNSTQNQDLAHQARSLLHREGFTVTQISNQRQTGASKTTIYYRPGTERVADAVGRTVYPEAGLTPSTKLKKGLKKGIDILVLLRGDLLENPQFMARLNNVAPPAAPLSQPLPAAATTVAVKTKVEPPAASHPEPLGVSRATAEPKPQPLAPQPKAVAAQPLPSPAPTPLTAAERVDTAIEVRNGTWTKDLARQTRSLLHLEGFTVAMIGNHVNFGATKTMIYYRPEAEKVARAVGATLFPGAGLEPSQKLNQGMDIKILLGADLLKRPQLMARLVAGGI